MDEKDPKDPSTTSDEYDKMLPFWEQADAVLGGTRTMREAGQRYLPKHAKEVDKGYEERLAGNVLFNMSELTLRSWVGRPFSDPVLLEDDVPEEVEELADDINLQGDALAVFLRKWFEQGLSKAFCHVLVDFPRPKEMPEGQTRTLADDREEGLRPYWKLIKPEHLIFAQAEVVDGSERLIHARIYEVVTDREGFAQVHKERIRVLEPGYVWIYELQYEKDEKGNKKGEPKWVLIDEYDTDLDEIPLVTFYADREGFMLGKPPMEDLIQLNTRWWQSNSDQINVLMVTRFPLLAHTGGTDDESELVVGPNRWVFSPNHNAKFYFVEHSGKAIGAGRQDLLDIEAQMANYGAEFLRKRLTNATATARAMDSAESTSPLQDVTLRFVDAVEQALDLTARWLDLDDGGSVLIATDFGPENVSAEDLRTLNEGRARGDLSRPQWLAEIQRRGILSDTFDAEQNERELEEGALSLTASPLSSTLGDESGDKDIDPGTEE